MSDRISVSSADFIRNIGQWQNEALKRPVVITHHGRERLVLAAADKFKLDSDSPPAEELASLRAKLAIFRENMADGYVGFTSERKVRQANAAAEALFGIARDDMIGRLIGGVFPEPLASSLDHRLERVIRSSEVERFELAIGERKLVVSFFPLVEGAGATFRNVTEEHELRRRVEEGEALLNALSQCAHASNIKLSADGVIENADEKLMAWTGLSATELIGRRIVDLFPAAKRAEASELVQAALNDARAASIATGLARRSGGEVAGVFAIAPTVADAVVRGAVAVFIASPAADESRDAA